MDTLRRQHNEAKKQLIRYVCKKKGMTVLDMGCGQGGDLFKWTHVGASVDGVDPNGYALAKAETRIRENGIRNVNLYEGDIFVAPLKRYDIVRFNFSLQYSFCNMNTFRGTVRSIKDRLKRGGRLIGTMFDSMSVVLAGASYTDKYGNTVTRDSETGFGQCGEFLNVFLVDTPYYESGPIPEPIAYKDLLITELERAGIQLESWEPLVPEKTGAITDLYCRFIFKKVR